jgi:hypothetical protein
LPPPPPASALFEEDGQVQAAGGGWRVRASDITGEGIVVDVGKGGGAEGERRQSGRERVIMVEEESGLGPGMVRVGERVNGGGSCW